MVFWAISWTDHGPLMGHPYTWANPVFITLTIAFESVEVPLERMVVCFPLVRCLIVGELEV